MISICRSFLHVQKKAAHASYMLLLFCLLFTPYTRALELNEPLVDVIQLEIAKSDKTTIQVKGGSVLVDEDRIESIIQQLARRNSSDLILTTDNSDLFDKISGSNRLAGLPIKSLLVEESEERAPQSLSNGLKRHYTDVKESIAADPYILIYIALTDGYEFVNWLFVSDKPLGVNIGNALLSGFFAATLGFNKNLWPSIVNNLGKEFRNLVKKVKIFNGKIDAPVSIVATNMLMNFGLALSVLSVRQGIIWMGSSNYDIGGSILFTLGLTASLSFSSFGWSQWIKKVSENSATSASKFNADRFYEIAEILVGFVTPAAALMQPETIFGKIGWTVLFLNGTVGLASFLKPDWTLQKINGVAKVVTRAKERVQSALPAIKLKKIPMCYQVFQ